MNALIPFAFTVISASAMPKAPDDHVELRTLKISSVYLTKPCEASVGDTRSIRIVDERRLLLEFGGYRFHFDRYYAGANLLFELVGQPGVPLANDGNRSLTSSYLTPIKTLTKLFREIEPTFSGFRVRAGLGVVYDPEAQPRELETLAWRGFTLNWLNQQVTFPDGEVRTLDVYTTELLRLFFERDGKPVGFDELLDYVFPGRRSFTTDQLRTLRRKMMMALPDPRLLLQLDERAEHYKLYVRN